MGGGSNKSKQFFF